MSVCQHICFIVCLMPFLSFWLAVCLPSCLSIYLSIGASIHTCLSFAVSISTIQNFVSLSFHFFLVLVILSSHFSWLVDLQPACLLVCLFGLYILHRLISTAAHRGHVPPSSDTRKRHESAPPEGRTRCSGRATTTNNSLGRIAMKRRMDGVERRERSRKRLKGKGNKAFAAQVRIASDRSQWRKLVRKVSGGHSRPYG